MIHITVCPVCKGKKVFDLDAQKYDDWKGGELIQNVWPEMSLDDRERLITGFCPECWKKFIAE